MDPAYAVMPSQIILNYGPDALAGWSLTYDAGNLGRRSTRMGLQGVAKKSKM
jgi:hypothetical protein